MTAGEESQDALARLRELAALREHPFVSRIPVLGRLIAAFRAAWNNVSTRWYVQPVFQQQTQFNQLSVDQFAAMQAVLVDQFAAVQVLLDDVRRDLSVLHEWVIAQDHEQTERSHDLGELALELGQLRRRLDHLPAAPSDNTVRPSAEEPAP